ncbi:MAG: hypothetical protein Q9167_000219 [Letrouitia subvulpina]
MYDGPARTTPNTTASPGTSPTHGAVDEGFQAKTKHQRHSLSQDKADSEARVGRRHGSLREPQEKPPNETPRRTRSSLFHPPSRPRRSLYNIRKVPPSDSDANSKETRPRVKHVPGSFRSQLDDSSLNSGASSSENSHNTATLEDPTPGTKLKFETTNPKGVDDNHGQPASTDSYSGHGLVDTKITSESQKDLEAPVAAPILRQDQPTYTLRSTPLVTSLQSNLSAYPSTQQRTVDQSSGVHGTIGFVEAVNDPLHKDLPPSLDTDTGGGISLHRQNSRNDEGLKEKHWSSQHILNKNNVASPLSTSSASNSKSVSHNFQENLLLPNVKPPPDKGRWMRHLSARKSAPNISQYPSNLTVRPARLIKDSAGLQRSLTSSIRQNPQSKDYAEQSRNPESFSRVITDLETLLKEALQIAGQANEGDFKKGGLGQDIPFDRQADVESSIIGSSDSDDERSPDSVEHSEEHHRTTIPIYAEPLQNNAVLIKPNTTNRHQGEIKTYHPPHRDQIEGVNPLKEYPLVVPSVVSKIRVGDAEVSFESAPRIERGSPVGNQSMQPEWQGIPASSAIDWDLKRQASRLNSQVPSITPSPATQAKPRSEQAIPTVQQESVLRERRPSKIATSAKFAGPDVSRESVTHSFDADNNSTTYFNERPVSQPQTLEFSQLNTEIGQDGRYSRDSDSIPEDEDTVTQVASGTGGHETVSDIRALNLKHRHHLSVKEPKQLSISRTHRQAPIARDWSTARKRWVALIACLDTALLGLITGIYAGEVPAIQYVIVDEHHYTILGNVVLFIGLAITTSIFWPLPLLHGRKPYTLAALAILMPLQFPQAIAVDGSRTPYTPKYRVALLLSRAVAGLVMGFANINFIATLLDLFGSSLQSINPHQELVNVNDVRRHGGGMGIWLGFWTWCFIGSIGVGFCIGAVIISGLDVSWGFWITIILTAFILLLNVFVPEVRRSRYRRSIAEIRTPTELFKRVARGEIRMHLYSSGPRWWFEEVSAGLVLSARMLKQPGFLVLSVYIGWIYGQIVMIIVLLGALTSRYYHYRPQYVGLCVLAIPVGAFLAIPFQKASIFSRSRQSVPRTDSMTVQKRLTWTSHFFRRAIFMISLPFAGLAYTLASVGPRVSVVAPTVFAGMIGFLSNLAIAECNGIIMETYDTSDLQPGMTGRPRRDLPEGIRKQRTNYSSFPRVTAAFAVSQSFAFLIAAAATGTGGAIERRLGAQAATAVVAGVLLVLTLLLIVVVTRFKEVQIIPTQRYGTNVLSGPEDEWKPVIIGNPSGTTRRMSLLELGGMTRWTEIRRRNRLTGLEGH